MFVKLRVIYYGDKHQNFSTLHLNLCLRIRQLLNLGILCYNIRNGGLSCYARCWILLWAYNDKLLRGYKLIRKRYTDGSDCLIGLTPCKQDIKPFNKRCWERWIIIYEQIVLSIWNPNASHIITLFHTLNLIKCLLGQNPLRYNCASRCLQSRIKRLLPVYHFDCSLILNSSNCRTNRDWKATEHELFYSCCRS